MKPRTSRPKVVIVGAGIAGSAVAWTLKNAEVDVVILEGQSRVGGRIHSVHAGSSSGKVELGANWFHGLAGNPLHAFCLNHGIFHEGESFGSGVLFFSEDGEPVPREVVARAKSVWKKLEVECFAFYQKGIETPAEFDDDLEKFVSNRQTRFLFETAGDEKEREILKSLCRQINLVERLSWGSDRLGDISLSLYGMYDECKGGDVPFKDGLSRIVDYLVEGSGAKLLLGAKVESITHGESDPPVKIVLADGAEISADVVVVTASLGCLKAGAIKFDPDLPSDKKEAIERIGFGVAEKILLELSVDQLKELEERIGDARAVRFGWKRDADFDDLQRTWTRGLFGFDFVNVDVLLIWVVGPEALHVHGLSDEALLKDLAEAFASFLKMPLSWISSPKRLLRTRWYHNEFTKGSYSYVAARGARDVDPVELGNPVIGKGGAPRLLFAGEATHQRWFSCLHGAFDSGVREGKRILDNLPLL